MEGRQRRPTPEALRFSDDEDDEVEEVEEEVHHKKERTSLGRLLARLSLRKGDNRAPLPDGAPPEDGEETRHGFFGRFSLKRRSHRPPLPDGPPPEDGGFFSRVLHTGHSRPYPALSPPSPDAVNAMENGEHGEHHRGRFRISRNRISRNVSHLFHHHNNGEFEFSFENPENDNKSDDSDDDDETMISEGASTSAGSAAERGEVKKVKGGVKGGGMGVFNQVAKRHICERIFMAALAVSVLWVTSYALARSIVNYVIVAPDWSVISERNVRAMDEATAQQGRYATCVEEYAKECEFDYNRSLAREIKRSNDAMAANDAEVVNLVQTVKMLELIMNETLTVLNDEVNNGQLQYSKYRVPGSSNLDVCQLVSGLVAGEDAAINAITNANVFKDKSETKALSLQTQIYRREQYDKLYIEKKTKDFEEKGQKIYDAAKNPEETFDALKAEVNKVNGCIIEGGTCSHKTAFEAYQEVYTNTMQTYTNMKTKTVTFMEQVQTEMKNFKDLINSLDDTVLKVFLDAGNAFNPPAESEASEPTVLGTVSSFQARLISGVAGSSGVFGGSGVYVTQMSDGLASQEVIASGKHSGIGEAATTFWRNWTSDYNPDPITADVTVNELQSQGALLSPSLAQNLRLLSAASSQTNQEGSTESANLTTVQFSAGRNVLAEPRDHSEWGFYSYSKDIIDSVDTGITDMSNLILYFDIAFRVLHTIFIIRKYWNLSALSTPPGDARVKASAGSGWGPKATPWQKIAAIVTNPIFLTLLLTATLVTLLYTVWFMYSPLFLKYVDGCVNGNTTQIYEGTQEGTMLYRNGYSIAFQYSASEGDRIATKRVDELNVNREVVCNQNTLDDTVTYNNLADMYNTYMDRLYKVRGKQDALVSCLDFNWIDGNLSLALASDILRAEFHANFSKPDEGAIYNCEAVGECTAITSSSASTDNAACAGPNRLILQDFVFDAACTSENWIHAQVFGTFMVFSTFVLMNIGRLFFMRAMIRLSWRHLVTGPFSFLGSCTDSGRIVYPEAVTEDGETMRGAIAKALKKRLRSWERWGYVLMVVALAINAPWIWGLSYLSENLTYKP